MSNDPQVMGWPLNLRASHCYQFKDERGYILVERTDPAGNILKISGNCTPGVDILDGPILMVVK